MREQILNATVTAIHHVMAPRFFQTERGYQGRFYCALQSALDSANTFDKDFILEMEYQKIPNFHGTRQRPDIILHAPVEHTNQNRHDSNITVWALKRRASTKSAQEDFAKLDEMVARLRYHVVVFVNIDTEQAFFDEYTGSNRDRLICLAVKRTTNSIVGYAQTEICRIPIDAQQRTAPEHLT